MGSKNPFPLPMQLPEQQIPALSEFTPLAIFLLVFNDLRNGLGLRCKQFMNPAQYLQNRASVLLRGGWFGLSFVTIMPTGVWVCSF
jgi:hypothetical protein